MENTDVRTGLNSYDDMSDNSSAPHGESTVATSTGSHVGLFRGQLEEAASSVQPERSFAALKSAPPPPFGGPRPMICDGRESDAATPI